MLVIGQTRLLPCSVTVSCMLGAADRGVRMLQEGKCEAAAQRSMGLNVSFVCVPDERRAGDQFKRTLQLTPSLSRLQSQNCQCRPDRQLETHQHCTINISLQIVDQ